MNNLTPVVELGDASFGYDGEAAVTGVTATIFPGDSVALIGPNGSGKSTLLKGMLGLAEHLSGTLRVFGGAPRQALDKVAYLPQSHNRDTQMPVTARQVVGMGLYRSLGPFKRMGRVQRRQIDEVLDRVGLLEEASTLFGEMSGGQQQRVILARSLVNAPQLVLMDEPFNGLDQPNRDALLATVNQLREQGTAVVVSTHDLDLARAACSHVMLLNKKQVAFGTLEDALTLDLIAETFADATVELDHHTVTTTDEIG